MLFSRLTIKFPFPPLPHLQVYVVFLFSPLFTVSQLILSQFSTVPPPSLYFWRRLIPHLGKALIAYETRKLIWCRVSIFVVEFLKSFELRYEK